MKSNLKNWRTTVVLVGIIVGLAIVSAPRAFADGPHPGLFPFEGPGVFPPDGNAFGMTYGDWSAAWWQWLLSIPSSVSPYFDTTGALCGEGQSAGPVFFLAGSWPPGVVRDQCTVPAGKAIFFPIMNVECSNLEGPPYFGGDETALRTCAVGFLDAFDTRNLKVSVDGRSVCGLSGFRAESPVFTFTIPNGVNPDGSFDNFLGVNPANGTKGFSVSDGFWVMLKPLKPGVHTIYFKGICTTGPCQDWEQEVTYKITVK